MSMNTATIQMIKKQIQIVNSNTTHFLEQIMSI